MSNKLRWGILGTGNIAKTFARGLAHSKSGVLTAIGSRSQESADKFGAEFNVPHRHATYEALLADKEVDAVYISTPHPMHAEWAIKTAEAKKHILCEKPIGMNHAETMAIIEAAVRNDVFLMEAFMYRCHPQTHKVVELIRQKAIGDVKMIQCAFSFHAGFNPDGRLLNNKLGGGAILDVGCYCTSMSGLIVGAAQGTNFPESFDVRGFGHLGTTNVDEYAAAVIKFPNDIIAEVSTGCQLNQDNVVRIYGTAGNIVILSPWIPLREGGTSKIILHKQGQKPQEIEIETKDWLYALEADTVAEHLDKRQAPFPFMSWNDSLCNMRMLDAWREQIGLVYEAEKSEGLALPVSKRPLSVRKDAPMKYGTIPGVDKQISRLVMGLDNQRTLAHLSVMLDDYFERGGNCFDTAWLYAGGLFERLFGQWIKNRNIREKIVILGKGAHTPHNKPEAITWQLKESFERMQVDYVDIYMMHRDNPDIPAGEFIEVLNEHKRKGHIRAFGGSNWSVARVQEANDYAKKKGLTGFAAVSNNFSLARMVDPVWAGCISASDADSRAWFAKTQVALMPWSSQARGFFTERADPKNTSDKELVRCWYAEDNWKRRDRAFELARKKNVLPISIALAYVLHQPFPTFALFGPRQLSETRTSMQGLTVSLTPEEVKWLNLEA